MSSAEKIEKSAKGMRFRPSGEFDERVLNLAGQELGKLQVARLGLHRSNVAAVKLFAKFAVAAAVIVGVNFLVLQQNKNTGGNGTGVRGVVCSHLDYIKAGALNAAYRRGGLKAVEENYEKAFGGSNSRFESLTTKQLLAEFGCENGNSGRDRL